MKTYSEEFKAKRRAHQKAWRDKHTKAKDASYYKSLANTKSAHARAKARLHGVEITVLPTYEPTMQETMKALKRWPNPPTKTR